MPYIELGEWTPDTPQHTRSKISTLSNMMPDTYAYTSVPSFKAISSAIIEDGKPAKITGSASFVSQDGVVHTFAGTNKKLYRLERADWVDVSIEGGYNGLDNTWQFAMYGNYVIATNYNDPIQLYDLSKTTKFEVMSSSAPRARTIAVANEFLFLGDTVDTYDNERPGRVWWSPIADPRGTWEPNQTTMCDYQDMAQGVSVVRILGGETAKIFMRNAVIRGTFVGSPIVFQFDVIEPARGAAGINSLANLGEAVYFLSRDGFFVLESGSDTPVGLNKLDKYVLDNITGASLSLAQCAIDYQNKIVWWAIPTKEEVEADENLIRTSVLLHYPSGKWGKVDMPFTALHGLYTKGYTLDELDEINRVLENLPFPLDSIMYKGGTPIVGCFDENGRLCYGYGEPMEASFTTGDSAFGGYDNRTFVRRVRLEVDGTSKEHTMSISGKQSLSDADSFSPTISLSRIGDFPCRKTGRYHKIKFNLKGDWKQVSGYTITLDKEGTQ